MVFACTCLTEWHLLVFLKTDHSEGFKKTNKASLAKLCGLIETVNSNNFYAANFTCFAHIRTL